MTRRKDKIIEQMMSGAFRPTAQPAKDPSFDPITRTSGLTLAERIEKAEQMAKMDLASTPGYCPKCGTSMDLNYCTVCADVSLEGWLSVNARTARPEVKVERLWPEIAAKIGAVVIALACLVYAVFEHEVARSKPAIQGNVRMVPSCPAGEYLASTGKCVAAGPVLGTTGECFTVDKNGVLHPSGMPCSSTNTDTTGTYKLIPQPQFVWQ